MDLSTERDWLQTLLTGRIPLAEAMQLKIVRLDGQGIALAAPLAPNVNDKGTAFGGALVSLMILAGWSLPRLALRRAGLAQDLVIGRCEVRFRAPVNGDFGIECDWPEAAAVDAFVDAARSGGRARLDVHPRVVFNGELAAGLQARYAAI
ncbi:MAG: YiiD C-terminal domain-containing protein [Wenzhouxiangellaceae bacterium]|nr:YiiD C-terminal domain-containing protein [Wenzhouxiangellaceae bacterium]